ncbi:MAG TPA: response regulator transcription factor [Bacteroidota bacterium]|nr:response regulator transcription factor [Bacteroidota bacterium]
MASILIVEDESDMRRGLKDNLEFEGFEITLAEDGASGLKKAAERPFDLIILDVMLPKMSGLEVCKQVRQRGISTPIMMLTAKGEEIDKVLGLELGADDYVTKPFGVRELLARIKALLRRAGGPPGEAAQTMLLGTVQVDFLAYTASKENKPLTLTPKEIEILRYLWNHKNKTVSRDELLKEVWGYDESISSRTVDNFMLKLRQKIEDNPSEPHHILTIHGVGYKLVG